MITKEQWLEDVKAEAVALKQHATKEELGRLDIVTINSEDPERCIYGQMTGSCQGERAQELILKSCKTFTKSNDGVLFNGFNKTFKASKGQINGKVNLLNRTPENRFFRTEYFSSIEHYISLDDAKNENLIAFLKGETQDLDL